MAILIIGQLHKPIPVCHQIKDKTSLRNYLKVLFIITIVESVPFSTSRDVTFLCRHNRFCLDSDVNTSVNYLESSFVGREYGCSNENETIQ